MNRLTIRPCEPRLLAILLLLAGRAAAAELPPAAAEPQATILSVDGPRFTLNGRPVFLLGISYYAGLSASEESIRRDLDDMMRHGFNWLRVWATWSTAGGDVSAVDTRGRAREPFLRKLQWLVAECDRRGLVVDVTLARGAESDDPPKPGRVAGPEAHRRAVQVIIEALSTHRNWYLDLANERDVRDDRYVSADELKTLRSLARRLNPRLLVTASFGGHDLGEEDIREALSVIGVDLLCPHRPREADSPGQTEGQARASLALMKRIGHVVPLHYQEPFRRGYDRWEPTSSDFLKDLEGAVRGGAAGWCLHNGSQRKSPDGLPHRSFDMSRLRLFEQLDREERAAVERAAEAVRQALAG